MDEREGEKKNGRMGEEGRKKWRGIRREEGAEG